MDTVNGHNNMDAIYHRLTGIHIGEQLDEWDARGKGYYGEFLLFSELYKNISGIYKILMNLQIPSENGRTTEIDLLLIHETGMYVFEAKHYKGTIYGKTDDPQWTQHFKTVDNRSFPNPILQNRWHVEQLRKLIPNVPIHSFIVFTSSECTLKVSGDLSNTTLCTINMMCRRFESISHSKVFCISAREIDDIFAALTVYSPIREKTVKYSENCTVGFYQFVEMLNDFYSNRTKELEHSYRSKEQELERKFLGRQQELEQKYGKQRQDLEKSHFDRTQTLENNYITLEKNNRRKVRKSKWRAIGICTAIVLFSLVTSVNTISTNEQKTKDAIDEANAQVEQYKTAANASKEEANNARTELQKFKKKWELITDFEINGEKLKEDYVVVDHVSLTDSADFNDVVYLSFAITHNGEDFYVLIDKSSMYTVVLKDGRVIETPCYSWYYSYSLGSSSANKTLEKNKMEFSGFSAADVAFIKMTNLQIKRIKYVYGEAPVMTDYEIVLYEAK